MCWSFPVCLPVCGVIVGLSASLRCQGRNIVQRLFLCSCRHEVYVIWMRVSILVRVSFHNFISLLLFVSVSLYLYISIPHYIFILSFCYLSVCLFIYACVYPTIYLCPIFYLHTDPLTCLSTYISTCLLGYTFSFHPTNSSVTYSLQFTSTVHCFFYLPSSVLIYTAISALIMMARATGLSFGL